MSSRQRKTMTIQTIHHVVTDENCMDLGYNYYIPTIVRGRGKYNTACVIKFHQTATAVSSNW